MSAASSGSPHATSLKDGSSRSQLPKTSPNSPSTASNEDAMTPVQHQTMDRAAMITSSFFASPVAPTSSSTGIGTGATSSNTRPGALRPPNELGRKESKDEQASATTIDSQMNNKHRAAGIHPRSVAVRKRSMLAIRGSMSQAAAASSLETLTEIQEKSQKGREPAMLCSLTYRGMEVIFATTHTPQWRIYGICARTRLVFQTLDLPPPDLLEESSSQHHRPASPRIVSVTSNPVSGMIAVAMSDGTLQTYVPMPTDPAKHPFGRFRWIDLALIRGGRVFYQTGEQLNFEKGQLALSSSRDRKLLVAHRNQLAIFDVSASTTFTTEAVTMTATTAAKTTTTDPLQGDSCGTRDPAQLLWTTSVEDTIVTASISGDGQAIAVVTNNTAKPGRSGVQIFVRDREDGSNIEQTSEQPASLSRPNSVGILYKKGPFLDHPEAVSRVSFRGLGHNTAAGLTADEEWGNDLLLTYSKSDCVARIFHQHGWNKLVEWCTQANSRVDWIRGAAAFSLGDLETQKRLVPKAQENSSSNPPSRSPSSNNLAEEAVGPMPPGGRQLLHHAPPSSAAGAWIAETTFSGAFPALKLSRLSFLKRGSETMHPALFESVSSILPAGSMAKHNILNSCDESLSIHGVWPAWNPWLSDSTDNHSEETLSGSAMAFLGLSSGPSATSGGSFGEGILGGTHSPPNELRIVSSHTLCGNVIVMELPLWGNRDLGELELGRATRFVLSLPDIDAAPSSNVTTVVDGEGDSDEQSNDFISSSTFYESSRLKAIVPSDSMVIQLTWQKQGTMSICPSAWESHDYEQILKESSFYETWTEDFGIAARFRDYSLLPAPLSLPPLILPRSVLSTHEDCVKSIIWWPDENFGGPPLLVVITVNGTLLVFEVPPPWSAHEPPMPKNDPFLDASESVKGKDSVHSGNDNSVGVADFDSIDDDDAWTRQIEYDVSITPDPDFGLGLRLESQNDGLPAIAGSYKKHPLTGARLPAEKTGMIVIGDELLSVNGVRLDGISFDEIISTVRQVGSTAGPGKPLTMKFRRADKRRREGRSDAPEAISIEDQAPDKNRRSREEMLGVSSTTPRPIRETSNHIPGRNFSSRSSSDVASNLTVPVGVDGEIQQEFCRLVAMTKNLFKPSDANCEQVESSFVLQPWLSGPGAPTQLDLRGAAVLFSAEGSKMYARRLEVSADCNPENSIIGEMGMLDLSPSQSWKSLTIRTLTAVPTASTSPCLAVLDNTGNLRLVFVAIEPADTIPSDVMFQTRNGHSTFVATFQQFGILKIEHENCLIRASSINLLATVGVYKNEFPVVTVWSSRPHPVGKHHTQTSEIQDYAAASLPLGTHKDITDVCFVQSGFLDSSPLLATFTNHEVVLYQRVSDRLSWHRVRVMTYPCLPGSGPETSEYSARSSQRPLDSFPHLLSGLRSIADHCDEQRLRTDWHPDCLVTRICTGNEGPKETVKKQISSYFWWLAKSLGTEENSQIELLRDSPVAPIHLEEPFKDGFTLSMGDDEAAVATQSIFESVRGSALTEHETALRKLQSALVTIYRQKDAKKADKAEAHRSQNSSIPTPLSSFSSDELRMLWAIGEVVLQPPNYHSVDQCGEFFIFSSELLRKVKILQRDDESAPKSSQPVHVVSFKRKISKLKDEEKARWQLPSSGSLFALLSSRQGNLAEYCRKSNEKIDWEFMKEHNVPLWMRSDTALAKLSEEVGQNNFRDRRDILECALFFIVARKLRTLRNLAATDQSDSGRKFFSFITSHDFSSERGRRAAEKNAYSLLRKRRYTVAAAFFLLAEPPFLKPSLEVIATQLQDLNLAFMVARLMESPAILPRSSSNNIGSGAFGVSSLMGLGGGAGYATSATRPFGNSDDDQSFQEWKPSLKFSARNLLLDRGLPSSSDDNCLTAIQLVWLNQRQEASFWLSGLAREDGQSSMLPDIGDAPVSPFLDIVWQERRDEGSMLRSNPASSRVNLRLNRLFNFASGPILLKALNGRVRTKFSAALILSSTLMKSGIDISSVRELLRDADKENPAKVFQAIAPARELSDLKSSLSQPASALMDGCELAPHSMLSQSTSLQTHHTPLQLSNLPGGNKMQSTIFDDFAPAPQRPSRLTAAVQNHGVVQSSIFDDYDSKPAANSLSSRYDTAAEGEQTVVANSSIFDSFETAPQNPKPVKAQTGNMTSSIFDAFDATPPNLKGSKRPTEEMTSSIFDSFEVPQQKPVVTKAPNREVNSSILDSFETPSSTSMATNSDKKSSEATHPGTNDDPNEKQMDLIELKCIEPMKTPILWQFWRKELILLSCARRLIRELAFLLTEMHGDAFDPPTLSFSNDKESLIAPAAAEILQLPCEGEMIIDRISETLKKLSVSFCVEQDSLVRKALQILASPFQLHRMFYAVLLHLSIHRGDMAEDLVRHTAHIVIHRCDAMAMSNDPPSYGGKTVSRMAGLFLRSQVARLGWQLELCLWLHRGGALPLSGNAINDAITAVRIGFAIASWNRSYECLETLIKCEPDCHMDNEAGRQLWTSLKIAANADSKKVPSGKTSSGGWEFLVDCKRSEATELLRQKVTGCFIIRPHVEDHGVFTLSFKTNLVPTDAPKQDDTTRNQQDEKDGDDVPSHPKTSRPVKKDDVVQHAIIRLSDSGFRCGSFGPFGSLMKLLEAVSSSLPFDLRFDQPPAERVIKDEGSQPSPNSVFLRKLVLRHADSLVANPPSGMSFLEHETKGLAKHNSADSLDNNDMLGLHDATLEASRQVLFGLFLELLVLSCIRKTLSAIASSKYEDQPALSDPGYFSLEQTAHGIEETESDQLSETKSLFDVFDEQYASSARALRSFLAWCRMYELACESEFAPGVRNVLHNVASPQITLSASETAIEAVEEVGRGDSVIRRMIQPNSGVDFRTLRLADGGDSTVVVLFSKKEATEWLINHGSEKSEEAALDKLEAMEKIRVIEPIDLSRLQLKAYSAQKGDKAEEHAGVRYRIVDPWEVEALDNREGETKSASIGRERFLAFGLGHVATACENVLRQLGGLPALELWTSAKGGVALTKAIASVHPPWERGEGGDIQFADGVAREPAQFANSVRQHLYRNSLFRGIKLPQRFLALVQVELLDLKNLTAPGGSLSLTVYALLRLRRSDSGAPLTSKTRTLDSAATHPIKLAKSSGPNAPASWGSVVRFRFPLPEEVSCDGVSLDRNREILFKGPPCVLQLSVYERKLLIDNPLGDADVKLDGLAAGGQLEEWVPLRTGKNGIHWFARIRLTLRFELMCLSDETTSYELVPSVGLRRIHHLSRMGGAQEDNMKKSMSTPDLLGYFESMVY